MQRPLSVMDQLSTEEKEFIKKVIRDTNPNKEELETVKSIVQSKGGMTKTIEKAKQLVDNAVSELENFPQNEYLKKLEELAKFIVEREF